MLLTISLSAQTKASNANIIDLRYELNQKPIFGKTLSVKGYILKYKSVKEGNYIVLLFKQKTYRIWLKMDYWKLLKGDEYIVLPNCILL